MHNICDPGLIISSSMYDITSPTRPSLYLAISTLPQILGLGAGGTQSERLIN